MKTNKAGVELIKEFEGFMPRWYKDPVGIWTIGYGHTDAAGSPNHKNTADMFITEEEATSILEKDLANYEAAVNRQVKVELNPNQFSALVSFTYNLGEGNLSRSTLLRKLNAGDYNGASAEFARWTRAGGRVLNGLIRRRAAEFALFNKKISVIDAVRPKTKPEPAKKPSTGIVVFIMAVAAAVAIMLGVD